MQISGLRINDSGVIHSPAFLGQCVVLVPISHQEQGIALVLRSKDFIPTQLAWC